LEGNRLARVLIILAAWAVSACATAPLVVDNDQVIRRADARWKLLIAGKTADAYTYLSPAKKALISLDQYQSSIKAGLWREVKVDSVECGEPDLCKVKVLVSYSYKPKSGAPLDITRPLIETWRRESSSGEWWFVESE
jgi:hypothetical protein